MQSRIEMIRADTLPQKSRQASNNRNWFLIKPLFSSILQHEQRWRRQLARPSSRKSNKSWQSESERPSGSPKPRRTGTQRKIAHSSRCKQQSRYNSLEVESRQLQGFVLALKIHQKSKRKTHNQSECENPISLCTKASKRVFLQRKAEERKFYLEGPPDRKILERLGFYLKQLSRAAVAGMNIGRYSCKMDLEILLFWFQTYFPPVRQFNFLIFLTF